VRRSIDLTSGNIENPDRLNFTGVLVAVYCMLIPLENVLTIIPGQSINRYLGILIIAWEVLNIVTYRKGIITLHSSIIPLLLFLLFAGVSVIWAPSTSKWLYYFSFLFNNLILLVILLSRQYSNKERKLIDILCALVGLYIAFAIIKSNGLSLTVYGRSTIEVNGSHVDQNNLALSLTIPLFCIIDFAKHLKKLRFMRIALYISMLIIVYAILFTGSRSGLLGLVFGCIGAFLVYSRKDWRKKLGLLLVFIGAYLLMLVALNNLPGSLSERFTISNVLENGASNRFDIWGNYWSVFKESSIFRIVFGYGYGNSYTIYAQKFGVLTAAHNDILQILLDLGIVGVSLYFYMLFRAMKDALKKHSPISVSLLIAAFAGLCSMEMLIKKMFWIMLFLAVIITPYTETDEVRSTDEKK